MQDEIHDPRDDEPFPAQLQLAVVSMREGGPGREALSRLRAGLGLPDPSGGETSGEPPAGPAVEPLAPSASSAGAAGASFMATPAAKALLMVGVAVTLGGLWWASELSNLPAVPASPEPAPFASAPVRPLPSTPVSMASAGASVPAPKASAVPSVKTATVADSPSHKGPSEVELISRAQAVVRTQPRTALGLCREHARRYPNGMLAQEREVLTVEALHRMGKGEEAREQSRSFLENHPDTALRNRVEQLTADAAP